MFLPWRPPKPPVELVKAPSGRLPQRPVRSDFLDRELPTYLDHLAVERGLSRASVSAYGSDLADFGRWLARQKLSPILAAMYSITGDITRFMHIWPYPSLEVRASTRKTAIETGVWPPPGGPDQLLTMHTDIYLPAPFSPIR